MRGLHQKGSLKLLFPRGYGRTDKTGVILNTAGGVTGGDRFDLDAHVESGAQLVLTTQAAERAYRAQPGEIGHIKNHIKIEAGGRCDWLPQETILYDGAALIRRLTVEIAADAHALLVEPVIFGRAAMGERVRNLRFCDRIDVIRDGETLFSDRTTLNGDAEAILKGTATGGGCGAMASIVLATPDADRYLTSARDLLPETGGISLIRDGLLYARLLASDGFTLRRSLIPLLRHLGVSDLPRTWIL
ncbi:MAG: urease accessory protein UreD [Sedimentitalea sp.]|uniref:urease accessory protein UreD n=1 Tax=Sedimentitalea sp. TaxID=2048915 RepID=UPI0032632360